MLLLLKLESREMGAISLREYWYTAHQTHISYTFPLYSAHQALLKLNAPSDPPASFARLDVEGGAPPSTDKSTIKKTGMIRTCHSVLRYDIFSIGLATKAPDDQAGLESSESEEKELGDLPLGADEDWDGFSGEYKGKGQVNGKSHLHLCASGDTQLYPFSQSQRPSIR
jgi:hypothetical protein